MSATLFDGDTRVEEPFFRMVLPGKWDRRVDASGERWNYNTPREQITVSIMVTTHRLTSAEQAELLKECVAIRRELETGDGITVEMSNVAPAVAGKVHVARYEGIERAKQRLFTCFMLLNPTLLATFYYEAIGMKYDEFVERGRAAFNSIAVAESAAA